MNESDAHLIAKKFLDEKGITFCSREVCLSVYIDRQYRPEMNATSGAWAIHFPRILDESTESVTPSTTVVLVDTASGEAYMPRTM